MNIIGCVIDMLLEGTYHVDRFFNGEISQMHYGFTFHDEKFHAYIDPHTL